MRISATLAKAVAVGFGVTLAFLLPPIVHFITGPIGPFVGGFIGGSVSKAGVGQAIIIGISIAILIGCFAACFLVLATMFTSLLPELDVVILLLLAGTIFIYVVILGSTGAMVGGRIARRQDKTTTP